jgi:hypothetical protein
MMVLVKLLKQLNGIWKLPKVHMPYWLNDKHFCRIHYRKRMEMLTQGEMQIFDEDKRNFQCVDFLE